MEANVEESVRGTIESDPERLGERESTTEKRLL
jgi:hypothetical protein